MRRSFYDPTSAPALGCQWEWENDAGTWTPYDVEVAITIEAAYSRQQPCLDLTPLGFCYLIDYQNMTQVGSGLRTNNIKLFFFTDYDAVLKACPVRAGEQTEPEVSQNPETG